MSRLKVAVIGVGALGRHHARILSGCENTELVAVADTDPEIAKSIAADFGCQDLTDHRALLHRVDAVSVVVPTSAHLAVAGDFLQRGIPVLVEKPLALNVRQSEQLVDMAQENNAILQVGHIERFNPAFAAARKLCPPPKYIRAERLSPYAFRSTDIGAVLDLMIHDIDLVLALVQAPVRDVQAFGLCLFGGHEDTAHARITFESGCIADLTANRLNPAAKRSMQILTLEGSVSIDFHTREVEALLLSDRLRYGPSPLELAARHHADIAKLKSQVFGEFLESHCPDVSKADALTAEIESFLDCVRTGNRPVVDGRDGLRTMQVAEQILQCIGRHQWNGDNTGPIGPLAISSADKRAAA